MKKIKLLLIEDDEQMVELLGRFLIQQDIEVQSATKPSLALTFLEIEVFDIIILDLSLPEMDGLALCLKIREFSLLPIIISSARSDLNDKLIGFENGADDYLPKPYSPKELLARIKTILKRQTPQLLKEETSLKKFRVEEPSTTIFFEETPLKLTLAEYEILKLLIKRINTTVSREDIANSIDSHRFDSGVESINILIGRIRKKLDAKKYDRFIQTVRGIGYRFVEE